MKSSHSKGLVLGVAGVALIVFASTALAGSSSVLNICGQPWILGTANGCNTRTELHGTTAAPQLQVNNAFNGAGGYAIAANGASGSAPVISGANSDSGIGVRGQSVGGTGTYGRHVGATGTAAGAQGDTNSTNDSANGVLGRVLSTTPGALSAGVRGINSGMTGNGIGVYGSQNGSGSGVYGTTPNGVGVYGSSTNGSGVQGASANDYGGVFTGRYGVYGRGGYDSYGGVFFGDYGGVYSEGGPYGGVFSGDPYGVSANGGSVGVVAHGFIDGVSASGDDHGGFFRSSNGTQGDGVYGSTDEGLSSAGVRGISTGIGGNGVIGRADTGTSAYGVAGISNEGYGVVGSSTTGSAGKFFGNVEVTGNLDVGGTLTKGAGAFRIDDPLDPAHAYLQHSFVESPDMKNVYDSTVTTDARGFATVKLPRYFQALNRDFRYQLTTLGHNGFGARADVWDKISHNQFTIRTDKPNVEVSWQVTGIRRDPYANAHRIKVHVPKPARAQRLYLHPELYGKPAIKGLGGRLKPTATRSETHTPARPRMPSKHRSARH
jgi:hypothetical protein